MFYLNDFNIASFQRLTKEEAKQKAQEIADTQKPIDPFVGQQAAIGTATVGSGLVAARANKLKKEAAQRQSVLEKQLGTGGSARKNRKIAKHWKGAIKRQVSLAGTAKKAKIAAGIGAAGLAANYIRKKLFTNPVNTNYNNAPG